MRERRPARFWSGVLLLVLGGALAGHAQGLAAGRGRGIAAPALLCWLSEVIRRVGGVGRAGYRPTLGETRK